MIIMFEVVVRRLDKKNLQYIYKYNVNKRVIISEQEAFKTVVRN